MPFYDIFNGDADGICALHQLRLAQPRVATLVTGVKRDVRLLERVAAAAGDELTVLDISLKANAGAARRALAAGARLSWFDHHAAGDVPQHANLKAHIDTVPDICTSLIVDRFLDGRFRAWAVVAAFGDNMAESARRAAGGLDLDEAGLQRLRELGECINYNAYGETVDDLHYPPADLYEVLSHYRDPIDFIEGEPVLDVLRAAMADDMDRARSLTPQAATAGAALYVMPDAAWTRRVHGIFANQLATRHPQRAHALLVGNAGAYTVSVRAPVAKPVGADALCLRFETGGGRQAAAGINRLPAAELARFTAEFNQAYPG